MLVLSEDQNMLMESARGAVAANAPISAFRKLRADPSGEGFSRDFWRECASLGWTSVLIPEAYGGIDFGIVGAGLIAREMARTLAPSPFLSTAVLAASAIRAGGTTAQQAEWLPRIARGEAIVGVGLDIGAPSLRATPGPEGARLDGVKHMVLDGHAADAYLIAADDGAITLLSADARGLSRDTRVLVDGRRVASVKCDGVAVGADRRVSADIARIRDIGRAVISAALCGVAEAAFARTLGYLKERRQFDRRIGSFQALQHRAAQMHIGLENAWSASLKALESIEADANGAALDVAVAKAKASDVACATTAECLQMHGGSA